LKPSGSPGGFFHFGRQVIFKAFALALLKFEDL